MNNLRTGCLTIDIQAEFHQIALNFAKEQDSVAKGKQVYLNTLAVLVLRDFLEESSFATDLDASDSWNPIIRCFHNVADLVVEDIGKIECLPIVEDAEKIAIPKNVGDNPIAYVVVLLSQNLDRAQLIGYTTPTRSSNNLLEIDTTQLQPIEDSIDYLFNLELANDYFLSEDTVATKVRERLQSDSISDIAAQFERIIRTVDKKQQQNEGVSILAELMEVKVEPELVLRSSDTTNPEVQELAKLAQGLLDKLQIVLSIEESSAENDLLLTETLQRWQQLYEQKDEVVTQISAYLGDREEKIISFLKESIYIENKYERSDRALLFFSETASSEQRRNDSSANNIEMDDEKLLDLVEELWNRLGL